MNSNKKSKVVIIDTSAVLSGKPINFDDVIIVTAQSVSDELKPGGKDYQTFQFLMEKGLKVDSPSRESIVETRAISTRTGDIGRLSKTDIEILALALDLSREKDKEPVILTDDYSIQNVANVLNIQFESISQQGIKKRFKWSYRCRGCGKKFEEYIKVCPICGAATKNIISRNANIKKRDLK